MAFTELAEHRLAFDAIVRRLIVVGEAASQVAPDDRLRYPGIEWRKIVGLRNLVIHHYAGIDDDNTWDVIQNHVPVLRFQVAQVLSAASPDA